MLLAMAALLQTGAPAQTAQPPAQNTPVPAWRAAGRAWADCVRRRIDPRLGSSDAAEAVVDRAMAGCTTQLEAVRSAITAERGAETAAANVERVRTGGRSMFLAYVAQRRTTPAAGTAPAATPPAQ